MTGSMRTFVTDGQTDGPVYIGPVCGSKNGEKWRKMAKNGEKWLKNCTSCECFKITCRNFENLNFLPFFGSLVPKKWEN